jgi:hypothetical protein
MNETLALHLTLEYLHYSIEKYQTDKTEENLELVRFWNNQVRKIIAKNPSISPEANGKQKSTQQ